MTESIYKSSVNRELFLLFYYFFFPIIKFPILTGTLFNLFGRQDYSNLLFLVYWCMCGCITMHRKIQQGAVRSAYQPPASSTFLSEQISHQQPANNTFLSQQISTSHQPPAKRTGCLCIQFLS
jgi:hypothetical protein